MKTLEEIKELAEKEYPIQLNENHYKPDVYDDLNEGERNSFIKGYNQCQQDNEAQENRLKKIMIESSHQAMSLAEEKAKNTDKIYTEEDLIKAKISVYDRYTEWNEEVASDARRCIERLNESLNKKN